MLFESSGMSSHGVVCCVENVGGINVDVNSALGMICGYVLMMQHCSTVYASSLYNVLKSKSSWYSSNHMISLGGWCFMYQKWGVKY